MSETALLRMRDVQDLVQLSKRTLYRLIAAGEFPAPIKPNSVRASLWNANAVREWIQAHASAAA